MHAIQDTNSSTLHVSVLHAHIRTSQHTIKTNAYVRTVACHFSSPGLAARDFTYIHTHIHTHLWHAPSECMCAIPDMTCLMTFAASFSLKCPSSRILSNNSPPVALHAGVSRQKHSHACTQSHAESHARRKTITYGSLHRHMRMCSGGIQVFHMQTSNSTGRPLIRKLGPITDEHLMKRMLLSTQSSAQPKHGS
jgi:hypothetical protein